MRQKAGIIGFFFVLLSVCSFSQNTDSANDSIRNWFPQKLGKAEWKPMIGLDARRSWYDGNPIKINGLRIGATYKGIHRFGGGYYFLKRNNLFDNIAVDDPGATDTSLVRFRINSFALFYQRTVYKSDRWDVAIPLMFSFGSIRGFYENNAGTFVEYFHDPYSAMNTGVDAKFFVLPWLAPRLHLGYRFTFNTTKSVKKAFDRMYYAWGVSVLPFELKKWIEQRKAEGRSIFDPRP
jgi:hypothetical protein